MCKKQLQKMCSFVALMLIFLSMSPVLSVAEGMKTMENISSSPSPDLDPGDHFPRGCVDCHVVLPADQRDVRLSTIMKKLSEQVDQRLMDRVANLVQGKSTLKGQHPTLRDSSLNIPADCLNCHRTGSNVAPSFADMMHVIHLSGGNDNHYLSLFQGNCRLCHKFNPQSGTFMVPSYTE